MSSWTSSLPWYDLFLPILGMALFFVVPLVGVYLCAIYCISTERQEPVFRTLFSSAFFQSDPYDTSSRVQV